MSFLNFGYIGFNPDTKATRFMEGLKEGSLLATKCKKCDTVYFPPKADCANCLLSNGIEWFEIGGEATLKTYTVSYFAPEGFEDLVPYPIGIAKLKEGPKVLAPIKGDISEEKIEIGMKLSLEVVKISEDRYIYVLNQSSG